MHDDIEKIDDKLDKKFDSLINLIMYGVGAVALFFIAQVLYFLAHHPQAFDFLKLL
jgi:hypothetical protein